MRHGAVQIVEEEHGRRRYELTERLYNLYHLLRRPGGDGRVRALVDILVHLYEPSVILEPSRPEDDGLLTAARGLRARLELQVEAAAGRPLPRELREVQQVLQARRDDQ